MVILSAVVVLGLFSFAGLSHLKEFGGLKFINGYIGQHLWASISLIVLFCCVVLGTGMYLKMRPAQPNSNANPSSGGDKTGGKTAQPNGTITTAATSATGKTGDQDKTKTSKDKQQHEVQKRQGSPGSEALPPKTGVAQDGAGNQQTVVKAPITQANAGGCNQQVVGGNNNSNICAAQPRKLTGDQKSGLAVAAAEIPASIVVVVGSADDGESHDYAEEIRQVFVQNGTTRPIGTMFGWHPKGVFIQVHSADDAATLPAQKLRTEMNQIGFSIGRVEIASPGYVHEGEIHILVGDQ